VLPESPVGIAHGAVGWTPLDGNMLLMLPRRVLRANSSRGSPLIAKVEIEDVFGCRPQAHVASVERPSAPTTFTAVSR
jgi:hypothetical protein